MRKFVKFTVALAAGLCVLAVGTKSVAAAEVNPTQAPNVATTIQVLQFGYDPGKIVLPYGATVAPDGQGNYVLAFLDTSFAVLNAKTGFVPLANGFTVGMKGGEIVYYKNINGVPITVTYNLGNCIARVDAGNVIAFYKNGSILSSKITNYGACYTVETFKDDGTILKNEVYDSATKRLLYLDDYVRTPGMIIRTGYDLWGNACTLPYYGDGKPAF